MKTSVRVLSVLMVLCMLIGALPVVSFAANAPEITVDDTGSYNRVISKKNYAIAPGVSETDVVWNSTDGQNQSKGYVMEVDVTNPYVDLMASYKDLGTTIAAGDYNTQVMSQQAAFAESLGYNVVGGINTSLRWGNDEPMGMLVINGEVLHNELSANNYFVVKNDGTAEIRSGSAPVRHLWTARNSRLSLASPSGWSRTERTSMRRIMPRPTGHPEPPSVSRQTVPWFCSCATVGIFPWP